MWSHPSRRSMKRCTSLGSGSSASDGATGINNDRQSSDVSHLILRTEDERTDFSDSSFHSRLTSAHKTPTASSPPTR
jgi:hypothetical protein